MDQSECEDMWAPFFEYCKTKELDVPQTCDELLQELKTNDAYNKMTADMCVCMIELLVLTHDLCVSGICSSSNTKEQLVDKLYTSKYGPHAKREGEEHFELLEKLVPDLIRRCVELRKAGESRQYDLHLKRKRFLIEDEKSSALSPAQNMEITLGLSPLLLPTKKQILSMSKEVEEGIDDLENLAPDWIRRKLEPTGDH